MEERAAIKKGRFGSRLQCFQCKQFYLWIRYYEDSDYLKGFKWRMCREKPSLIKDCEDGEDVILEKGLIRHRVKLSDKKTLNLLAYRDHYSHCMELTREAIAKWMKEIEAQKAKKQSKGKKRVYLRRK